MSHWQCVIWAPDHPIRKSLYLGFCSTCLQTPLILSPGNWTHWNGYCVPTVQCREVCTRQLYNPQWMLTNVHEPTWWGRVCWPLSSEDGVLAAPVCVCRATPNVVCLQPILRIIVTTFRCDHYWGNEGFFRHSSPCDICPGLEKTKDIQANKHEMHPVFCKYVWKV